MKTLFPILFGLLLSNAIQAQKTTVTYSRAFSAGPDSVLSYHGTYHIKNATKDELYTRASLWLADICKKQELIVPGTGNDSILSGDGNYREDHPDCKGFIHLNIEITVSDGKYKYEVGDFTHTAYKDTCYSLGLITMAAKYGNGNRAHDKQWNEIKATIADQTAELIQSLQETMRSPQSLSDSINIAFHNQKIIVDAVHLSGRDIYRGAALGAGGLASSILGGVILYVTALHHTTGTGISGGTIAGAVIGSLGIGLTITGFSEIAIGGRKLKKL